MNERNVIYTVMTCEKLGIDPKTKFPDMGSSRLVGWYKEKDDAFEAVRTNACDICECCYNYVIIEAVEEGLYQPAGHDSRWFFAYNRKTGGYDPLPEPAGYGSTVGFTIG